MEATMADKPSPHQRETKLADDYLTGAQLAREVSHYALLQALQQAKAGELRDPAKTAMNAAITSGTLLDKRLILEGRPTSIVQTDDPKRIAASLARKLGVTLEATATEITDQPQLETSTAPSNDETTLQRERASGKPRARAKRSTVQTPTD
jgi:hypothetical protein